MIPKDIELRKQWRKELETWGPENIRIALNNQTYIPNINREFAWEWLRDQDNERPNKDRQYAKWNLIPTPHQSELAIYGKDVMERTSLRLCSM